MIVGADKTSDDGILHTSARLYGSYHLRRVYYSAFSPIPDSSSSLPLQKPPLLREHRLYQADWLMRFYGFSQPEILAGSSDGMLDLAIDPKLAWALRNGDCSRSTSRTEKRCCVWGASWWWCGPWCRVLYRALRAFACLAFTGDRNSAAGRTWCWLSAPSPPTIRARSLPAMVWARRFCTLPSTCWMTVGSLPGALDGSLNGGGSTR